MDTASKTRENAFKRAREPKVKGEPLGESKASVFLILSNHGALRPWVGFNDPDSPTSVPGEAPKPAATSQKSSQRKNAYLWTTVVANGANTRLYRCICHDPRKRRVYMAAVGLGRRGRRDGGGRVKQRASVRTHVRLDERSADLESTRVAGSTPGTPFQMEDMDETDGREDRGRGGERGSEDAAAVCIIPDRKGRQGVSCFVSTASRIENQVTSQICIIQCPPRSYITFIVHLIETRCSCACPPTRSAGKRK